MGVADWSTNPASNATLPNINLAEGQAPSTLNNSMRQVLADIKNDIWPSIAVVASATSTAALSAVMKRDADGRAQVISGSATLDIVNVGQLGVVAASLSAHAAATDAHSATSAATASRIMLRDSNGRSQAASASATADVVNLGQLNGAIDGLVYTGSSASNTVFPEPTTLMVETGGVPLDRNASATVYLATNPQYYTLASNQGAALTGTWRSRGRVGDFYLMQRVP